MNSNDMDEFLRGRDLPGVIGLAVNQAEILYEGAFGVGNTSSGQKLEIDSPHAIMSMTKPVTSFATMMLIESGELSILRDALEYKPPTDFWSQRQSPPTPDRGRAFDRRLKFE